MSSQLRDISLPNQPSRPINRPDFEFIKSLQALGYRRIIGIDEVGLGALAGPIIVVAVELDEPINNVNDSKLISSSLRTVLAQKIIKSAQQLIIGQASNFEIDQLGLAVAQKLAYQRALAPMRADLVLTDNTDIANFRYLRAIKGDQLFYPTAAASIVAKVYRDQLMQVYHHFHPQFHWKTNVGYGTPEHKITLDTVGPSLLHRQSFLH